MNRNKQAKAGHIKKLKQSSKPGQVGAVKERSFVSLRWLPEDRKSVLRVSIIVLLLISTIGTVPLPQTFEKTKALPYTTDEQKTDDLELGDSKVIQEGRKGKKISTISSQQSLWGRLFGWEPTQQKEVSSKITKEPVTKVVVNGTKKYQYMLCSDGSSRQYTDEQIKDPDIGFTSRSKDYCRENGQGEMLRLSETQPGSGIPPGGGATSSAREPTVSVRDGCTYTSLPYRTVYRDASWLNKGETQVSKGSDGTQSSCGWSTNPVDEEVLVGTREPSSGVSTSPGTSGPDNAAYSQCLSSYNSSMSQIRASESQGVAGLSSLKRQVESDFSRCKRDAGF